MATVHIIVDNPYQGVKAAFTVPDDMAGLDITEGIVDHFQLRSATAAQRFRLLRGSNAYTVQDADTLQNLDVVEGELFVLLLEHEIHEFLKEARRDQLFHLPSFWEFLFGLLLGSFFIAFTFPTGVATLGHSTGWSWVQDTGVLAGNTLNAIYGVSGSVRQMMILHDFWLALVVALALYLLGLLSLSLRHGRFDLFASGFLFLFLGTACLQLLAWAIFLLGWAIYLLLFVVVWLLRAIGYVFVFIGAIIAHIVVFLIGPGWWLLALLLAIACIYLIAKYRSGFFKALLWVLGFGVVGALLIGAGYLLIKLLQLLAPVFAFLAPVFAFIGRILGFLVHLLFVTFIVLFAIYGCGALLMDQFRGAWNAGNGKRGVMLGALSIGLSLALVLLETNIGNFLSFPLVLPPVSGLAAIIIHLFHDGKPLFDMSITLLVLGVSIIGLLRNFAALRRGPGWREFQSAVALAAPVAIVVGLLLLWFQGLTHDNS